MSVRREDIKWALVEDEAFFNDDDGVIVFDTRKEARRYSNAFARFYRQHEIARKAPKVVKVHVVVAVIKRDGKPQDDSTQSD